MKNKSKKIKIKICNGEETGISLINICSEHAVDNELGVLFLKIFDFEFEKEIE